jgi:hypothetical protein
MHRVRGRLPLLQAHRLSNSVAGVAAGKWG